MENLYQRLKQEYKDLLVEEAKTYPATVENLIKELEGEHYAGQLRYYITSDLLNIVKFATQNFNIHLFDCFNPRTENDE